MMRPTTHFLLLLDCHTALGLPCHHRRRSKKADNEEDEDDERKANTHGTQEASAAFVDTMQYKHQRKGRGLLSMHRCAAWKKSSFFEYSDMK